MKLNFQFSNLCGTVYRQGNVIFTPDGNSVISPVGNRVSVFDLANDRSYTMRFENRKNISRIALSPSGSLLVTVDEDGSALVVNFQRHTIVHRQSFKQPVHDLQFSPDGTRLAVTHNRLVQVWRLPSSFADTTPLVLEREMAGAYDDVVCVGWSPDSDAIVAGCRDMSCRVHPLHVEPGLEPAVLTGHRDAVVGAWFSDDSRRLYTAAKDGALFVWKKTNAAVEASEKHKRMLRKAIKAGGKKNSAPSRAAGKTQFSYAGDPSPEDVADDDESRRAKDKRNRPSRLYNQNWIIAERHFFKQPQARLVSVDFHSKRNLVTAGFTNGVFGIWELPDFVNIHTLSISQKRVDTAAISPSGDWLAFGSAKFGQLLVWEWQSESYVLKQQGHNNEMTCLCYSGDGQYVVTGGEDGKLKLWNTHTGFCFVTFSDHTASVVAVEFSKRGQVVFSASLDGTVRAYDMIRYRNFRTFTTPTPVQFAALAVDPSGEIVCAGSADSFEVFVWSVQTGKLLDIFSGHTGPIITLSFSPTEGRLISGSWDTTVRSWDVFGRSLNTESLKHTTEVLAMAYRPDGREIAVATLDGQISFWDVELARLTGSIDGRQDISGGRRQHDRMTAANASHNKHFTSLCYSTDGTSVLAGGNSKYVCVYDVRARILLRKFQISHNLSLDGTREMLNSGDMTEAGPRGLLDAAGAGASDGSDAEERAEAAATLPGAQRGDRSLRATTRPEARTRGVRVAPSGRTWAAVSTEGLLLYALDDDLLFDPFDLEPDLTPEAVLAAVEAGEYARALALAFRLGEGYVVEGALEAVPPDAVAAVARALPAKYLARMLQLLARKLEAGPRVQFYMLWTSAVLRYHAVHLKDNNQTYAAPLRALYKSISGVYGILGKVTSSNINGLRYVSCQLQGQRDRQAARPSAPLAVADVTMEDLI
ncbi:hypothetical protein HK405_003615 [Cladochytrium tenue]|nr:hypothetical protein HK405_003615 [Cladochytrium tenue]